jgi:uncharacterized protein (TIGR02145 family)
MKKFIVCFSFLFALSIYAQEPSIKFYLDDGSFKSYFIADIDSLSVSKSDSKYVMNIYYQDTNIAYYPNEIIQSVKIEKDTSNQLYLNVYIFGFPKPYLVSDIDSIVFKIDKWQPLTIGTQVWMLKNLDVDHYRNGDSIPDVQDGIKWENLRTGAWCYLYLSNSYGKIYGKLYNWYAVNDPRGLAPLGWHVPSNSDWNTLCIYLGGKDVAGVKLKETGTTKWLYPNEWATNESGFSALPGGQRFTHSDTENGRFYDVERACFKWSSTEFNTMYAWYISLSYGRSDIPMDNCFKEHGFSVRCVKDDK